MKSILQKVAFNGISTTNVSVQVHLAAGLPSITIVGLAAKSVTESKERVRAALSSLGLSLPPKRISVNLSPADIIKEGAHFDLPIALAIMVAMGAFDQDLIDDALVLGELSLDGSILSVSGVLPAAIAASAQGLSLICPEVNGREAAWAGDLKIIAAPNLPALCNHLRGNQPLVCPTATVSKPSISYPDMADIKGQETARRALEIAAVGGHNLLMIGPPGAGKSMLAARLPSILPELSASEALEVTMIHSITGELPSDGIVTLRPFRDPHHSASMAALIGGGHRSTPGELSLAHRGILFMDELPEFQRNALDSLRQPLETGEVVIARANQTVRYPASIQLVAAMNPCRCGYLTDPIRACKRAPICASDYQNRLSGPMLDRFDMTLFLGNLTADQMLSKERAESSDAIKTRVIKARSRSAAHTDNPGQTNAKLSANFEFKLTDEAESLLRESIEKFSITARGYHKVLRVARSIRDLDEKEVIKPHHLAEALTFRSRILTI